MWSQMPPFERIGFPVEASQYLLRGGLDTALVPPRAGPNLQQPYKTSCKF